MTSCRRDFLLKYFGFHLDPMDVQHNCCDNCAILCKCSHCDCADTITSVDEDTCTPCLSHHTIAVKQSMLEEYFSHENAVLLSDASVPEAITGLSKQLVKEIARNTITYGNKLMLKRDFPFLQDTYLENIHQILQCTLND